MGGSVFNCRRVNNHCLAILSLLIVSNFSSAELGLEDPTRPSYERPATSVDTNNTVFKDEQKEVDSSIPPLSQLIFSQNRQIAIFGDDIVKTGDETVFGKIIEIQKDRVLIEVKGVIQKVIFSLDDAIETDEQPPQ